MEILTTIKAIWLTGLSGSGKTALAEQYIKLYPNTVWIDGDEIRKGLCSNLGFSDDDRKENIRRVAHVCKLLNDNGLSTIVSLITPSNEQRLIAKNIIGNNFKLVYLNCSLEKCELRDVKGLYKKARMGELKNFTGIGSAFEMPTIQHISIDTDNLNITSGLNILKEIK